MGVGAMTGRAAGLCAGFGAPGFANPVGGRGCGMGFGRGRGGSFGGGGGRGRRNMYHATGLTGMQRAAAGWPAFGGGFAGPAPAAVPAPTREQQIEALKAQAGFLGEQLDAVKSRIEELSAPDSTK